MLIHLLLGTSIAFAFAGGGGSHKRIRSKEIEALDLPFSDAVWAGDLLFVSGHIGLDPQTGRPPGTAGEEARLVMEAFRKTLESAGLGMDDLVSVQVFCSDVSLFQEFNAVYRTYFHGQFPTRAFLGSGRLLFDARFEVLGVAARK